MQPADNNANGQPITPRTTARPPGSDTDNGGKVPGDTGTKTSTIPTNENGTIPHSLFDKGNFLGDPNVFKNETVYFDFDSNVVKPGEVSKVEKVAEVLKKDAANHVEVEGHCDERGTEDYNKSLGERRALAVREALAKLGVAPERVHTITYGESRPADPNHNDQAFSKNRRGEFILLIPRK